MRLFGIRTFIFERFPFLEPIALVWVLAFTFYMGFLPKDNYQYPLHVDEWFHYTYARSTLDTGHTSFENPYYGERGSGIGRQREAGFHVLLDEIKLVSGISWITLFRFMPALVLVAIAFLVYVLGRKDGFGLEGAILVALVPTTLRLMGPTFLIPLSIGLFLTPVLLLLYYRFEFSPRSTLLAGLFILFLLLSHPATGVLHLLLFAVNLAVFVLAGAPPQRVRLQRALVVLGVGVGLGVAVLVFLGVEVRNAWAQLTGDGTRFHISPVTDIVSILGILPFSIGVGGVMLWSLSKRWAPYGLGASMLCCLILFTVYSAWRLGEQSVGDRGIVVLFLLLAIAGGAGLAAARQMLSRVRWRAGQWAFLTTGIVLAVILLTTIPMRRNQEYYYLINDAVYYDAVWIDQYVDKRWKRVLSNPVFGVALPALNGKFIYANSSQPVISGSEFLVNADKVLAGKLSYTWMTEKDVGVSIVYARKQDGKILDEGLNQPRPGVYLVQRPP